MEQIIKATSQDVESLVQLVNHAYRGEEARVGWTNESDLLNGDRINTEQMDVILNDPFSTILKFVLNDEIVGCVLLQKELHQMYLGMLSVKPKLQNLGIGKKLITASELYASSEKCTQIKMTVFSVRTELIEWYKKRGYIETGELIPFTHAEFGKTDKPLVFTVLIKQL